MTTTPHYVLMNGTVWIAPSDPAEYSQCTARTKAKRRCKNPLEYSQATTWSPLFVPGGEVHGYDLSGWPASYVDRWLAQRCTMHWALGAEAAVEPEWCRFGEPQLRLVTS